MAEKEHKNSWQKIFLTGLIILIPIAATAVILFFLFNLFDGWLAPVGGHVLRAMGFHVPRELKRIPGFGILATILLTFLTGLIGSNFFGRKLVSWGQSLLRRIPLVNTIYIAIHELVNAMSMGGTKAFQTVVLVQFPYKGLWSLGFVTAKTSDNIRQVARQKLVNVFVPTAPNPTSGFLLMVPEKSLKKLPISVEDGVKMVTSVGLLQGNGTKSVQDFLVTSQLKTSGEKKQIQRTH